MSNDILADWKYDLAYYLNNDYPFVNIFSEIIIHSKSDKHSIIKLLKRDKNIILNLNFCDCNTKELSEIEKSSVKRFIKKYKRLLLYTYRCKSREKRESVRQSDSQSKSFRPPAGIN
jgi:hypothetical protein